MTQKTITNNYTKTKKNHDIHIFSQPFIQISTFIYYQILKFQLFNYSNIRSMNPFFKS